MYARHPPDERYSNNIRIPNNYSGNAFTGGRNGIPADLPDEVKAEPSYGEEPEIDGESDSDIRQNETENKEAAPSRHAPQSISAGLGGLFKKGGGGIGFEELLILGLILLISQNDNKDDLAFLLMMLLFIQ